MSPILEVVLRDDKACYPCISYWANNYIRSAGEQTEILCEFDDSLADCWDCHDTGQICAPIPGLLSGDRIVFFAIFKHVSNDFFAYDSTGEHHLPKNIRLEVSMDLAELAKAFVRLVETHKAEFQIDGARENDLEALTSYRSAIHAREASMKASFLPLHHGATFEEKAAYDKACTPRLSHYDRGNAAWVEADAEAHHNGSPWKKDCRFVIRTSNGSVFLCQSEFNQFRRSPLAQEQYTQHLDLLRRRSDKWNPPDTGDACNWLSKPFEPLIAELAPLSPSSPTGKGRPTLSDYIFAPRFSCTLGATDEKMQALRVDDDEEFERGFRYGFFDLYHKGAWVTLKEEFLESAGPEIKTYHPSDVELWYNRASAEDVLIKRPGKVFVHGDEGRLVTCFVKPSDADPIEAREEIRLSVQVTLNMAPPPAGPRVSRLRGIVRDGTSVFGLLFDWIDVKGRLVP
ncbi:Protein kinase-like domain [Apiospora sp. TS-2023a]